MERLNRARSAVVQTVSRVERDLKAKGNTAAADFVRATAISLKDRWWPDRTRLTEVDWHSDPRYLEP